MAQSTRVATPKRVRARDLRQKFNRRCLSLLKLPAVLRRSKDQSTFSIRFTDIGIDPDFEAMIVVHSGDSQLNFSTDLHMNRRGRILVFLRCKLDDLHLLILCHDWTGQRKTKGESCEKRR